jgi:hypothetical protein
MKISSYEWKKVKLIVNFLLHLHSSIDVQRLWCFCMGMTWLGFASTCLHNGTYYASYPHFNTLVIKSKNVKTCNFIVYFIVSMSLNNQGIKIIKILRVFYAILCMLLTSLKCWTICFFITPNLGFMAKGKARAW